MYVIRVILSYGIELFEPPMDGVYIVETPAPETMGQSLPPVGWLCAYAHGYKIITQLTVEESQAMIKMFDNQVVPPRLEMGLLKGEKQ
jgi:hypothetical protein